MSKRLKVGANNEIGTFEFRNTVYSEKYIYPATPCATTCQQRKMPVKKQSVKQVSVEEFFDLIYHNKMISDIYPLPISQIAKVYGLTGRKLNQILCKKGVQVKVGNQWKLTKDYENQGYEQYKNHVFETDHAVMRLEWTKKGTQLIYSLLHNEYKPFMSKKENVNPIPQINHEPEITSDSLIYKGVKVFTSPQLVNIYGASDPKNIHMNYIRNSNRYTEGIHYFKLEGEELQNFKKSVNFRVPSYNNTCYLWTKKGAMLHGKSLNTHKAWKLFDNNIIN